MAGGFTGPAPGTSRTDRPAAVGYKVPGRTEANQPAENRLQTTQGEAPDDAMFARRPEQKLRIVLYVAGGVCATAIVGVIAPWTWAQNWADFWYGAELPDHPVVEYSARVACVVFACIGAYFFVVARKPLYYIRFLNVGIAGLVLAGMVALIAGVLLRVAWWGYVADVVFCWATGALLLVYSRSREARRRRTKRPYYDE